MVYNAAIGDFMFTKEMLLDFLKREYEDIEVRKNAIMEKVDEEFKEAFLKGVEAANFYTTKPFNKSLTEEQRANINIMYPLIAYDIWTYRNSSLEIRNDQEIAEAVLAKCGMLLKDVSARLRNNVRCVALAVWSSPYALQFASPRLKDNEKIVDLAIYKCGRALVYASNRLKSDEKWIQRAFDSNGVGFIVDDKAARVFNYLDAKLINDSTVKEKVNGSTIKVLDEERLFKHKIYRNYAKFYAGEIISAKQMINMQKQLLEDCETNYEEYNLIKRF